MSGIPQIDFGTVPRRRCGCAPPRGRGDPRGLQRVRLPQRRQPAVARRIARTCVGEGQGFLRLAGGRQGSHRTVRSGRYLGLRRRRRRAPGYGTARGSQGILQPEPGQSRAAGPLAHSVAGFRETVLDLHDAGARACAALVQAMALSMGAPEDFFVDKHAPHASTVRFLPLPAGGASTRRRSVAGREAIPTTAP